MDSEAYQVWCDVGGTFTDCFVVDPNGERSTTKVLSHGRFKGRVSAWVNENSFIDSSRHGDPDKFWDGSIVRWIDQAGRPLGDSRCIAFENEQGKLTLEASIDSLIPSALGRPIEYELIPGLEAPVLAARWLMRCPPNRPMPRTQFRLGTTRGTNALLTRNGARTVFATTEGFADLLTIGYQERPELFNLDVRKRTPLAESVVEIPERLSADGSVLRSLDQAAARERLQSVFVQGFRSIAICLIHAYLNPEHELLLERIAQEIGFECICISSRVAPFMKAVSRGETTVVDAYLTPVVREYLDRINEQLGERDSTSLRVMTSGGGLVRSSEYRGRDSVLSGPAGGAVALETMAGERGIPKLIGLDMGGTSTDVCRIDGRLQIETETIKAGVRMMAPTLAIHTVASGGGSICWFDGVQLRVGPQSAGSSPGPACYGAGGPLSITDLNLLENRIDKDRFPFALNVHAARLRLQEVLVAVNAAQPTNPLTAENLIDGFRRIANEQMASAVRSISIERGADPRDHVLVGFGGAAGQHICEIAELLGIDRLIDHPDAGLLSALGMGVASIKRSYAHPLYQKLSTIDWYGIDSECMQIRSLAKEEFDREGIAFELVQSRFELELRYVGTEGTLVVDFSSRQNEKIIDLFQIAHRQRFGYERKGRELELVAVRAEFASVSNVRVSNPIDRTITSAAPALREYEMFSRGKWRPSLRLSREQCYPGLQLEGPALIAGAGSTTIIDDGWIGTICEDGSIELLRQRHSQRSNSIPAEDRGMVDPVLREVLAQRIAAIADQMGIVLEQTAMSVNVKDRRDFSCAVFASNGDLIANAPHVPVHLGAMSETVRAFIREFPSMRPGDCFITNDPYRGGSHLPDITVVTPVFVNESNCSGQPDFFVASRAHHAEVGGIAPGSMAPTSTKLGDEGVIIPPMYLVQAGEDRMQIVEQLLRSGPYPSRSVAENLADLAAQQAANMRGVVSIQQLAIEVGTEKLKVYLEHILEAAHVKTSAWIRSLENRDYRFSDHMDDGTRIEVAIRKQGDSNSPKLVIDFEGTGPTSRGNLNANPAIVTAAVLYVVRCSIADTLPLNSGVLRAIEIVVPPGILNPPTSGPKESWPAVAGGNVETSQRVVDCLLGALGLAAASQGTMNNFLFGNASFGYYETIGGGAGATARARGESAVHTHMTNTRLTDVEVLERKYPVRLMQFRIRRGSGGEGTHRGGDGMVREIMALEPLEVSLVTGRRGPYPPFGLLGGQPGLLGENWVTRIGSGPEKLLSACQLQLATGDRILINTPGGGGFSNGDRP